MTSPSTASSYQHCGEVLGGLTYDLVFHETTTGEAEFRAQLFKNPRRVDSVVMLMIACSAILACSISQGILNVSVILQISRCSMVDVHQVLP